MGLGLELGLGLGLLGLSISCYLSICLGILDGQLVQGVGLVDLGLELVLLELHRLG